MEPIETQGRARSLPGSIPLADRWGRAIPNCQDPPLDPLRLQQCAERTHQQYPIAQMRHLPTGQYNAHGLVFAQRRTGLLEPAEVRAILRDEGYREVRLRETQAGDVVLYLDGEEIAHSGIVLAVETDRRRVGGLVARVLSKWGGDGEYVHYADQCPYVVHGERITYWTDRDEDLPDRSTTTPLR